MKKGRQDRIAETLTILPQPETFSRCDPSAGTPSCKGFAGGLKLLKDFSGGIV